MTQEIIDFVNESRAFCSFIETKQNFRDKEFLKLTRGFLAKLYFSGLNLPSVDVLTEIDFDFEIGENNMKEILSLIAERVPFQYYWAILNPTENDNLAETGTGDLIDDLGDIYKDLKRGLMMFDKDEFGAKQNAIWKFKFDFDFHWGEHCVEALSVIHHYFYANS